MMFSATFNKTARQLAKEYMADDYVRIRVGRPGQSHKNIRQHVIEVDGGRKRDACLDFLMNIEEKGRTLIFCNSKPGVDLLDDYLFNTGGLPVTSIHGERPQIEREDSMYVPHLHLISSRLC
jgi:ATP-dependent RNA helicase DDX3X